MAYQTINALVNEVTLELGNRSDLAIIPSGQTISRVVLWIKEAYLDFAMSYPFEDLESTVPDQFVPNIDTYAYPDSARAIKTVNGQNADGTMFPVKRKHIRVVRRYTTNVNANARPAIYASYANTIIVRPIPDISYTLLWDVWMKPQFTTDVISTQILLPDDWIELLRMASVMRGHNYLLERDKAREIYIALYGDPTKRNRPGLIREKMLKSAAENVDSEYAIRPMPRVYTSVR